MEAAAEVALCTFLFKFKGNLMNAQGPVPAELLASSAIFRTTVSLSPSLVVSQTLDYAL